MKTKYLIQNLMMSVIGIIFFASCDKIEPPFNENLNSSSSSEQGYIELTSIPGTVSNLRFEKNFITDSTLLNSSWIITNNGTGLDGIVTFKWHNSTGQISGTGTIGGPVTFDGTVSMEEGGLFGKIIFDYSVELSVSGSGDGIAVGYVYQNVLVEDYTGHTCGNCPRASRKAYEFKNLYGDRFIVLGVHAGFFAWPQSPNFTYDFQTPAGNAWNTYFGIEIAGNPNGMVNREIVNGSRIIAYTAWGSTANNIFNEKDKHPDATIHIDNNFDATSRNLTTNVSCAFLVDFSGVYKLSVCLVEDSVVQWQKDYDLPAGSQDVPDYVHRDVLRGDLNGIWGEDVITSVGQANSIIAKTYTKTIDADFNETHCKVLAFLYNDANKEIVQVKEVHVLE